MISFTPRWGFCVLFTALALTAVLPAAGAADVLPGPSAAAFPDFAGRILRPGLLPVGATDDSTKSTKAKKGAKKATKKATKDAEPKAKAAKSTPAKKSGTPLASVKAVFDLQTIYDDNIFRFSDENLLSYRRGETPWKFGMDTYDDFIMSPRFTIDLGRKILGPKETTFRVKYTLWQYASNPDKSNSAWFLRLRQPVRAKDAIELSYTYAPPAYIRQLSDRPPFVSRAVPLEWMDFKGTRNAFGLAYSARLSDRVSLRLDGGRVLRYYNKPFLENDQWEWNAAATGSVKVFSKWSLGGKYQYSNAESRALDTTGETPLTSDDGDGSAERDLYQGTIAYAPSGLWKVNGIEFMAQTMTYYYTTKRPYFDDPTHTGRKDKVSAVEATVGTRPVYGPVTLELGYRYTTRSSSSAATDVGADAIEEDKNYSNNRLWLGMSWPL